MADNLLDILKYTIPALIVFGTVYYLMKNFLNQQLQMESMKYRQETSINILQLKLQAYERLALFCERISIDNLAYRLMHTDMGVRELQNAMLIAIQQEYEHNMSQQIYVSENLWKIVSLSKDRMLDFVSSGSGSTPADFIGNIKTSIADAKADPVAYARMAVRDEAQLLL